MSASEERFWDELRDLMVPDPMVPPGKVEVRDTATGVLLSRHDLPATPKPELDRAPRYCDEATDSGHSSANGLDTYP